MLADVHVITVEHTEWMCTLCYRWLYASPADPRTAFSQQQFNGEIVICICGAQWERHAIHEDRWAGIEDAHVEEADRRMVIRKKMRSKYNANSKLKASIHVERLRLAMEEDEAKKNDFTILNPLLMYLARGEQEYSALLAQAMT